MYVYIYIYAYMICVYLFEAKGFDLRTDLRDRRLKTPKGLFGKSRLLA